MTLCEHANMITRRHCCSSKISFTRGQRSKLGLRLGTVAWVWCPSLQLVPPVKADIRWQVGLVRVNVWLISSSAEGWGEVIRCAVVWRRWLDGGQPRGKGDGNNTGREWRFVVEKLGRLQLSSCLEVRSLVLCFSWAGSGMAPQKLCGWGKGYVRVHQVTRPAACHSRLEESVQENFSTYRSWSPDTL